MTSLSDINKEDKRRIIVDALRHDRKFFFEYILSHYIKTPQNIGSLHSEWFDLLDTEKNLGIIAPREHSKSTIINLADNLFDICNHGISVNQPYIVIFSDTEPQAVEHLGNIVEELEGNDKIHDFYGPLYEARQVGGKKKDKWSQSEIITSNGVKVVGRGWRFRARGMRYKEARPSKICIDDIENDEDVNSSKLRVKLKNTFEKKILNLGSKDTKIRMVGTILHFDSLLKNEYEKQRPEWTWRFYTAIKDNTPLWPEWWDLDRLNAKRDEIGSLAFEQEFMNNPIDPSVQIINAKEFYDHVDLNFCDCYGYIDLAISEKETADYTAIVTIAKHRETGKLYVIDPVRMRGSIAQQIDLVFKQHEKYRYRQFGVESVAYQKAFYQVLKDESTKRGRYIPVIAVEVDKDKIRRATQITPFIENGTILFNASHQDFMSELRYFPLGDHDDFVDAFTGAVALATRQMSTGGIKSAKTNLYTDKL